MKRALIESSLRREIISGTLAPGGRLPTRVQIENRFDAGPVTVQQALDRLVDDGFVIPRGRLGTFVSTNPPHLSNYALVFPGHPSQSRFWSALWKAADTIGQTSQRKVEIFEHVSGHVDDPHHQQFLDAVKSQRLAGLIFAATPVELRDSAILKEPGLPKVVIMSADVLPGVGRVELGDYSYVEKALDFFQRRGRKRMCVLAVGGFFNHNGDRLIKDAAARGILMHGYWQQSPDHSQTGPIRNCVQLLMSGDRAQRPDALWIADDNFVEEATAALATTGLSVPRDLDVIAHCNFPWPAPSSVPVTRLGFDANQILQACMENIDLQRQARSAGSAGDAPLPHLRVPAVFEEEIVKARA